MDSYGGDYKFMLGHGLNIYKEEDRAEGRSIMRVLTATDGEGDFNNKDTTSDKAGQLQGGKTTVMMD